MEEGKGGEGNIERDGGMGRRRERGERAQTTFYNNLKTIV